MVYGERNLGNIPYVARIDAIIQKDIEAKKEVFPEKDKWFEALTRVDLSKLRVVIIGQDPYPSPLDACGMAFASGSGNVTSSLRTMENEIRRTYNERGIDYTLREWAEQGVLLLNTCLTFCKDGASNTHRSIGWEEIVNDILATVLKKWKVVVVTLGGIARQYYKTFQEKHPTVFPIAHITSVHPSPRAQISARQKMVGGDLFKNINRTLISHQLLPIKWFH